MKKMDKILTYENRKMSMASMRSSITWIIMPRQNSNIFTFQLIFKSKFYIREERFRDIFLRTKSILLGIARMSEGGGSPIFLAHFQEVHYWSLQGVYFLQNASNLNFKLFFRLYIQGGFLTGPP